MQVFFFWIVFHCTLRTFQDVMSKRKNPMNCDQMRHQPMVFKGSMMLAWFLQKYLEISSLFILRNFLTTRFINMCENLFMNQLCVIVIEYTLVEAQSIYSGKNIANNAKPITGLFYSYAITLSKQNVIRFNFPNISNGIDALWSISIRRVFK